MSAALCALAFAPSALSATFTVTNNGDTDGVCIPGSCSLREAIKAANADNDPDVIQFSIGLGGLQTITPATALPTITQPVTIDGYTQPGSSANTQAIGSDAALAIELNGNNGLFDGLVVTSGGTTIAGLVINNFRGDAIELRTNGNNLITGNFIGTNATGTGLLTNGSGIYIENSPNNRIGGDAPAARNVIASSANYAIRTTSACTGDGCPAETGGGNIIQGNYIGTDKSGTAHIATPPSGRGGIYLSNPNNVIGGTTAGARNVMSTVGVGGIVLAEDGLPDNTADGAHHNTIQGNYIGVDATGGTQLAPGSGLVGITIIRARDNLIGGTTAGARNVIASASGGISIFGVSGPTTPANNVVQGNYIGTDATGTVGMPVSAGSAVTIDSSAGNTIGGTADGAGNVLSRSIRGVHIQTQSPVASNNVVQGNFIGTTAAGTAALPNSSGGVLVSSTGGAPSPSADNTIGGTSAGARNVISGNGGEGIAVSGAANTTIQGNYIGVGADGSTDIGNSSSGVSITGTSNTTIGGITASARNVISGNGGIGLVIQPAAGVPPSGLSVTGNYIGTDAGGTADVGNSNHGVVVAAAGQTIGGTVGTTPGGACMGACNLISGNDQYGIVDGTSTTIQGNMIGTNAAGTAELGNEFYGVMTGTSTIVGGTAPGAGNVISGNDSFGINVNGSGGQILGNYIGLSTAGTAALGNCGAGIDVSGDNNVIGGTTAAAGNVISGNGSSPDCLATAQGIELRTSANGNQIQGNYIGTNAAGTARVPNHTGIEVGRAYDDATGPSNNTIGGTAAGAGNVIAGNGGGIVFFGAATTGNAVYGNWIGTNPAGDDFNSGLGVSSDETSGNLIGGTAAGAGNVIAKNIRGVQLTGTAHEGIRGNSIHSNDELGIDLIPVLGPNTNDAGDGDTGPNGLQNVPELSSATAANAETEIQGVMRGGPSLLNMEIEFFASPACDGSGHGEGQTFLGSITIVDQSGADYPFTFTHPAALPAGYVVTATATTEGGDTSEFSACRAVTANTAQPGPTFTVNTAADATPDGCTTNHCTLREAINAANVQAGANSIHFGIGAGGSQTIQPTSPLPALVGPTVVDGTTQSGFAGAPLVVLNGASAGSSANGLIVSGGSSQIRGLIVNGFTRGSGIVLDTAGSNVVAGNWIGTNATGSGAVPNATGITIAGDSDNNTIGGTVAADRNLVFGNALVLVGESFVGGAGVTILSGSTGNAVKGNDVAANVGFAGIRVFGSANTIGGTAPGSRNVVSSNLGDGIALMGDGNTVEGNHVGVTANGDEAGNEGAGVYVSAANNTVGGTTAAARNVISANVASGVWINGAGATGNVVQGNYIGTDPGGTLDRGNDSGNEGTAAGVFINGGAANNVVGGALAGARNVISGNETGGVEIEASPSNSVRGNLIGTTATGTAALANDNGGVVITGAINSTIGGPSESSDFNLISGNATSAGVTITGEGASGNVVRGNRIGTTLGGDSALPNQTGVMILDGAHDNAVGASGGGAQQVISGNALNAVHIQNAGTNNAVRGNRIGVGLDGTTVVANDVGVVVDSGSNQVGGTIPAHRNVISGNTDAGVLLNSGGNTVAGNFIGTDASGSAPAGNGIDGIRILSGANTIGGTTSSAANVISGNVAHGIEIASDGNVVRRNFIGTDLGGTTAVGNGDSGISILSSDNDIGNEDPSGANKIAFNGTDGVTVTGSAENNRITANSIVSNGDGDADIGIDLAGNGVSGNDPNDADTGPNKHQNFPVLTAVTAETGSPKIVGTLSSEAQKAYRIDYYETPCAGPGDREGERWLGWSLFSTNADGVATIDTGDGLTSPIQEGEFVTATATDPDGNTSEFSACRAVTEAATPASATITLASDQTSVIGGAQKVPTGGIDLADLRRTSPGTRSAPLDAVPLDAVPLDAVPLDAVSLGDLGLTAALLREVFGGVHLSEVPLDTPGGWAAKLAGTRLGGVPLNTITLADVYALNESTNPDAVPLDAVPLDAVDLSGTPLDAVGLGAVALGATPLDAVPLDAVGTNSRAENAQDWCSLLNPPDPDIAGYSCPPIDPSTETVLGAAIKGVPLDAVPLDAVPLDAVSPGQFPLDAVPLDAVPLDAVTLVGSPLDAVPLDAVNFAVSPLDAVPLDAVGPGIIDCSAPYSCAGKKLGQAVTDGRLVPGATLGQLVQALKAVAGDSGASVADLIFGLPPNFNPELTFGDLFALVLGGAGAYDWSQLDLSAFPINEHSPDGGVITYHATFTVTGGAATQTATIHAALPAAGRYKAGSTQLASGATTIPLGEPQAGAAQLEWTKQIERGVQYELTWQVHAPIALGTYAISANVIVPGMDGAALSGPVSVGVTQTLEPNDVLGAGAQLEDDALYFGYMLPGDVDRHRIPIPAAFGSRVKITLSHIANGTDLDLAVAGPPSPTLRNAPPNSIPLQNGQLSETKVALDERGQALPPETLQDVPTDAITGAGRVIRATSDNRGNADEEVTLLSQGETGEYVVQVSDFEGDSPMPYMLEIEVEGPPDLGNCDAPRSFPFAGQGVAGTMPTIPTNVNTLILVNRKRLGDTYGAGAATSVINSLNQLAGRADLGIVGAVIPVESNPAVASAYTAWDGNPCAPAAANNVVSRIGQLVDTIEPDNLQYKVIVGGDDQIPFARVADETVFANEEDYAASLSGANNQYKSAYGHGLLLTDDVYAEEAAPQFLGHELFVPDQAVGRLVETPNEITGMISAFLAPGVNGAITPQRSVATGYDFLTDGANAVNTPLNAAFGAGNARTLINENWPARDAVANNLADDLEDSLFPPSPTLPPQLNSVNAHFDHTRLLPAAENAASRAANLYTSQDVRDRGASAVAQRILFSMGCHSGLATSDAVYGSTDPMSKDWAQTFLAGGAFAWIGNTGFGLGDTVDVAYTERLHALFAGNLDGSLSLGEALAQAKQEYLSTLAIVGGYDAKVVMQTTLYGLPMLDIGAGTPVATPPQLPLQTDPATGLQAASFNQSPSFTLVTKAGEGSFYRAQSTQATNRRPIEPVVSFDVTQPGRIAHGVVITSLQSLADESNFDAAFSRVVNDKSEDEPEVVGEASHPAKIQSLSTFSHFASPATTRQNAVLIAGLYRSDGNPDPAGIGIHRLYSQIGGYVLYAPPGETDFTPPELGALQTIDIGNGVGFAVDVTDAEGIVKDVKVIYRDCAGVWRLSTLQNSGGNRWSGGGTLASTCEQIDYYVQAVDDAGNVAVSSKKVQIEPLTLPPATGATTINISPAPLPPGILHASGWYTGGVNVTLTATPASALQYSLDGRALQPYSGTFTVSGDGVHFLEASAADGSTATEAFAIDTSAPAVLMTTPPTGAVYELGQNVKASFTCADSGSGPATCTGNPANGAALDTGSLGTKTITVTATDVVGHSTTFSRTYDVVYGDVVFSSSRTGNGDIYTVPSVGGPAVQLTSGSAIDAEPAWSPDRSKIAFSSSRTGNGDIYVLNLSTNALTQLTSNAAVDTSPAWSPGGDKIAFASNRAGGSNFEIYVMDAVKGEAGPPALFRVTNNPAADTLPSWSPSGLEIAFMSTRTGNGDIYKTTSTVFNPSPMRMTTDKDVDAEPAWSPKGTYIAFSTNRHGNSNFELYAVKVDNKAETRLTNQSGNQVTPAWSRDAAKLAFMSSSTGNGDIYTAPVAATPALIPVASQTQLTSHTAIDALPDW